MKQVPKLCPLSLDEVILAVAMMLLLRCYRDLESVRPGRNDD